MCQIIAKLTVLLMLLIAGVATAGQGIWQDVSPQSRDVSNTTGLFQADDGALRCCFGAFNLCSHLCYECANFPYMFLMT